MSNNYFKTVKTIFAVISLTFLAKFLGFFRDAVLGSKLGADMESDAYLMALNSTSLFFVSTGSAIVSSAIPIIVEHLTQRGRKQAFAFVNNLLNILIFLSTVVVLIGILFSEQVMSILARGFDKEKLILTVTLTRIMFPILICICITYVFVAMLQSLGKFKVTSIISFPANMVIILFLFFSISKYGVKGLAVVTFIGWILQFVIQLPFLYKEGYRYSPKMCLKDKNIKKFFSIILPVILVASVNQINILLDENQASFLEHGKISFLHYANMLYLAITTTTVYGVSTVMFPKLAEKAGSMSKVEYGEYVHSILKLMIFILLPMTTGIILLRIPMIGFVFERGAFQHDATISTGMALACYTVGMIGFGIQDVLNKAFYAQNDIRIPIQFAIFTIGLNVLLNMMLVEKFDIGGLAIATACASILGATGLFMVFRKKMGYLELRSFMITLFKVIMSCLVMGIMVFISLDILNHFFTLKAPHHKILLMMIPTGVGVGVYGVITLKLKIREALTIYNDFIKPMLVKFKYRVK